MDRRAFESILVPIEFEFFKREDQAQQEEMTTPEGEHVVVGPYTVRALELAARLCGRGELWLVHAHEDYASHATWISAQSLADMNAATHHRATNVLTTLATRHCPEAEHHIVVAPGDPLALIMTVAEENPPDCIVLAASSRGKLSRAFHGSTADKMIRQALCPVVVVPSGTP